MTVKWALDSSCISGALCSIFSIRFLFEKHANEFIYVDVKTFILYNSELT